jgi:hypothetical protein
MMKNERLVTFEAAEGLGHIQHACFHRGQGLSRSRDKHTSDLFELVSDCEDVHKSPPA